MSDYIELLQQEVNKNPDVSTAYTYTNITIGNTTAIRKKSVFLQ